MRIEHDRMSANGAEITSKVIEGEAIIINLRDGTYYSLDAVGSVVWECVLANSNLDEIVAAVTGRFEVAPETARADCAQLLSRLAEQKMLLESDRSQPARAPTAADAKSVYAPPQLHTYHDMAELLALDPPTPGVLDNLMRERIDDGSG